MLRCLQGLLLVVATLGWLGGAWAEESPGQASEPVELDGPLVEFVVDERFRSLLMQATAQVRGLATVNDEGDAWQLFRRMRPLIRDALGTRGYFAPVITREIVPSDDPNQPPLTRAVIELGPLTMVTKVSIEFEGEINNPEFAARRERLRTLWVLSEGLPFSQTEWTASKESLLADLLARDFAAATLVESLADINPDRATAELRVVYDSGPVFTFGELAVTGIERYPAELVSRYNTIKPGDRYEQERLLRLLSELQNTTYFSGVDVRIDTDEASPRQVPIEVTIQESNTKRLGLGAGYSTNTGLRTEATYQFNNLFDRAYSLVTGVRVEQRRQSAYADVFMPPSRRGVTDSVGVSVDRQDINDLELLRTSVGAIRAYALNPKTDVRLGVNYQQERREAFGIDFGNTRALVGSAAITFDQSNDRLNPTQGYVVNGQAAVASENLASDQDFVRLYGRYQHFWELSSTDFLTARFELGGTFADARRNIPQDYLFRAGGTNSIRGFRFLGVGVFDQGVLVGGRRLAIGSLEYTRYVRGPLGYAVFTDVGDVADSFSDLDPKPAFGGGVRYKTPAGPLALDIARALDERKFRIHFSLGVAF